MKTRHHLALMLQEIQEHDNNQREKLRQYFHRHHHPEWTAELWTPPGLWGRPDNDPMLGLEIKTDTGTRIHVIWEDRYVTVERADSTISRHINPLLDGMITAEILGCAWDDGPCDCNDEEGCPKHTYPAKCECRTRTCEHDNA